MNQSRRELEFLQEQALLLEKNSVSLTQITPKSTNNSNGNNGNKKQQQSITPNVNITPSIQQPTSTSPASTSNLSKYSQLLMVIEEMSRDIRPTYSGSRGSAERLKRTIVTARILVRECLLETEKQNGNSGR